MPEPLVHFAVPFAVLALAGFSLKKVAPASALAMAPDLDVLLHVHRWVSHSMLVVLALFLPAALVLRWKRPGLSGYASLCALAVLTHPLLDMFDGCAPILWPALPYSVGVESQVRAVFASAPSVQLVFKLELVETSFAPFSYLDAPVATGLGVVIAIMVVAPVLLKHLSSALGRG